MSDLPNSDCPPLDRLESFAVDPSTHEAIGQHIDTCPRCRERIDEIRQNNALMDRLAAAGAPIPPLARESKEGSSAQQVSAIPTHAGPGVIEGYEVISEIHRGGQGIVYRALQKATKRQVAVKLILQGALATSQQRRRFEREVELVATLRHPNIVTVYDSGMTADGRHFYVMEYVEGQTLHEYVEARWPNGQTGDSRSESPVDEMLGLFAVICDAVNYAHQRGVIHRDLKPSNILVDAEGRPRVVDFGLAKAVDPGLEQSGGPTVTVTGEFMGTLSYAAPEQVRGDPSLIDTRTDVYALGVILYEMLTGEHPYPVWGSVADVIRAITETEPAPPSSSFREKGAAGEGKSDRRIAGRINDEVDTIVLKSLAKEPERRYQSVSALGQDVRRYLAGEPIEAKRDSTWYMMRKTLRRYRGAAAIATVFVMFIVGYGVTVSILARRADHEARKATAINEFLQGMLVSADPDRKTGSELTVGDVLDAAAERVEDEFADEPEIKAALHSTIGNAYLALAMYDEAELHLRQCVETLRRVVGDDHPDYAKGLNDLALLLHTRGDDASAEPLFHESLELERKHLGKDHPDVASTLNNLAMLHHGKGEYDLAESLYREALAIRRKVPGDADRELTDVLNNLGAMLIRKDDLEAAEPLLREALDVRRKLLGDEHALVAQSLNTLAAVMERKGDRESAERLYRESLAMSRNLLGEDHPRVAITLNNLAMIAFRQGDYTAAEPLFREAVDALRRRLGDAHPNVANALGSLAATLHAMDRTAEAEPLGRESVAIFRKALPEGHPVIARCESALGGYLTALGRYDEAEKLLLDTYSRITESSQGEEHPAASAVATRIIELYDAWDKPDKAAEYRDAIPKSVEAGGSRAPQ